MTGDHLDTVIGAGEGGGGGGTEKGDHPFLRHTCMYMFRAICKFAQFRNCVAQFENFEIAYRFRNCPPIIKLPPDFEICLWIGKV